MRSPQRKVTAKTPRAPGSPAETALTSDFWIGFFKTKIRGQIRFNLAILAPLASWRFLLPLVFAGCANAGKAEAGSLSQAIERYRVADNSLKGSMAEALDQTPCSVVDVCETKRACLAVSGPTARALALKHQVEVGLAQVRAGKMEHDSPEARALPDKLDEAARLLEEGHAALPTCDEKLQALKRKYGI